MAHTSIDYSKVFSECLEPANICTEPAAIMFTGAVASKAVYGQLPSFLPQQATVSGRCQKKALKPEDTEITVELDQYTYKEMYVKLFHPSERGEEGAGFAASLGVAVGNPENKLNIITNISQRQRKAAAKLAENAKVSVNYDENAPPYVKVTIRHGNDVGEAILRGGHTDVVSVRHNGEVLFSHDDGAATSTTAGMKESRKLSACTIEELYGAAQSLDVKGDAYQRVKQAVEMNRSSMHQAVEKNVFSLPYLEMEGTDAQTTAKKYVTALTTERMDGVKPSITTVCGSGNQAIQLMSPIVALAEKEGKSEEELVKATAFGILVTQRLSNSYGALSAACGCAQKAGPGAAAGSVLLKGGSPEQAGDAMKYVLKSGVGMICEGAGEGCVPKLSSTTGAVFDAVHNAMHGKKLPAEGLTKTSIEDTIDTVGDIIQGMRSLNEKVVKAMSV